jgi:hypothetical protein
MLYDGNTDNLTTFARCPSCGAAWSARESFLADPGVRLIGYRVSFIDLIAGLFLFQHRCGATLALHASEFADLYAGPIFDSPQTGGEKCPGYCLRAEELRPCPARCECAFVREIVNLVYNWPKRAEADVAAAIQLGFPP